MFLRETIQISSPQLLNYFFFFLKKNTHAVVQRTCTNITFWAYITNLYMCRMGFVEICGPHIISWQIWAWEYRQVPVSLARLGSFKPCVWSGPISKATLDSGPAYSRSIRSSQSKEKPRKALLKRRSLLLMMLFFFEKVKFQSAIHCMYEICGVKTWQFLLSHVQKIPKKE